jgi:hypothetical protein
VSIACRGPPVEHADATLGMLRGELRDGSDGVSRTHTSHGYRNFKIDNRIADV